MTEECIKIKRAENGFIVTEIQCEDVNDKGNKIFKEFYEVIEEDDNGFPTMREKETLKRLLILVAEKCGYMEDKWGKENLRISFDGKGRKCEDGN